MPETGKILISKPFLNDNYFRRSVVLLINHNNEGTFGLILNKPTRVAVSDILISSEFEVPGDFSSKVFLGGPVGLKEVFVLHSRPDLIKNSTKISEGVYFGGDFTNISKLIHYGFISVNEIKFFLGYSGWTSGQLDDEIMADSWVVCDSNPNLVLKYRSEKIWNKALLELGDEYAEWINYPPDPSMN